MSSLLRIAPEVGKCFLSVLSHNQSQLEPNRYGRNASNTFIMVIMVAISSWTRSSQNKRSNRVPSTLRSQSVNGLLVCISLFILTLLSAIALPVAGADQEIPTGFKADRYQKVWERNPFTLVTPTAQQVRTTPFDKLILLSWLNDGVKDVVLIQNTETSEVQKVTNDPNPNNLRLVRIDKNADPKKADIVLSNGAEQGSVKFRLEAPIAGPQVSGGQQTQGAGMASQNKFLRPMPVVPPGPPISRPIQLQQNAQQQALQPAVRLGAAQMQQGTAPVGAPAPYQAPNQSAPVPPATPAQLHAPS